jgi:hypothetical protein
MYSTYLGGSGSDGVGFHRFGIALSTDTSGSTYAYVAGVTTSTDFPTTPGAYQRVFGGGSRDSLISDAFVAKYDPTGAVVYSSYFGGNGDETAYDIAADSAGDAYLTGYTRSTNLPTTPGALQTAMGATATDAFVTKFNASGSGLVYSTYLGGTSGTGFASGAAIAVDGAGNAYVTGETTSPDFPTTPGGYQVALALVDAFVTKLNATGTALLYSSYFGGSAIERGYAIAVDNHGSAYVTGDTTSTNLPVQNAFQPTYGGVGGDSFVAKFDPSQVGAASLVYSSYLGGSDGEEATGVTVDGSGNAYVSGYTASTDFPTKNPFQAQNRSKKGMYDTYLTKITGG